MKHGKIILICSNISLNIPRIGNDFFSFMASMYIVVAVLISCNSSQQSIETPSLASDSVVKFEIKENDTGYAMEHPSLWADSYTITKLTFTVASIKTEFNIKIPYMADDSPDTETEPLVFDSASNGHYYFQFGIRYNKNIWSYSIDFVRLPNNGIKVANVIFVNFGNGRNTICRYSVDKGLDFTTDHYDKKDNCIIKDNTIVNDYYIEYPYNSAENIKVVNINNSADYWQAHFPGMLIDIYAGDYNTFIVEYYSNRYRDTFQTSFSLKESWYLDKTENIGGGRKYLHSVQISAQQNIYLDTMYRSVLDGSPPFAGPVDTREE